MDLCYCPRSHADINMERSFDDCSFHEGRDEENSLMGRVEHNMEELFSEMNVAEEEIEVVELKAGGIRALLVDGRIVREEINTEDVHEPVDPWEHLQPIEFKKSPSRFLRKKNKANKIIEETKKLQREIEDLREEIISARHLKEINQQREIEMLRDEVNSVFEEIASVSHEEETVRMKDQQCVPRLEQSVQPMVQSPQPRQPPVQQRVQRPPVQQRAQPPVQRRVPPPVQQRVQPPVQQRVQPPVQQRAQPPPVQRRVQQPVQQPVKQPMEQPIQPPAPSFSQLIAPLFISQPAPQPIVQPKPQPVKQQRESKLPGKSPAPKPRQKSSSKLKRSKGIGLALSPMNPKRKVRNDSWLSKPKQQKEKSRGSGKKSLAPRAATISAQQTAPQRSKHPTPKPTPKSVEVRDKSKMDRGGEYNFDRSQAVSPQNKKAHMTRAEKRNRPQYGKSKAVPKTAQRGSNQARKRSIVIDMQR